MDLVSIRKDWNLPLDARSMVSTAAAGLRQGPNCDCHSASTKSSMLKSMRHQFQYRGAASQIHFSML
jgi:hypothetical protein